MQFRMMEKIRIFLCYAHEDKKILEGLHKHLVPLRRSGLIEVWYDCAISAGTDWSEEIKRHLHEAHIILLLASADFIASTYCYDVEMQHAMERHEKGEARVIPIMVRPVVWQDTPFGKLQALPRDAKPINTWQNEDEALADVAERVRQIVAPLASLPSSQNTTISLPPPYLRPRHSPIPARQEEVPKVLDPEEVWERIQRKDVPSTWHILGASRFPTSTSAFVVVSTLTFYGGLFGCAGSIILLVILAILFSIDPLWIYLCLILGPLLGGVGGWGYSRILTPILVLMPEGFIYFSREASREGIGPCPCHIISYKVVEAIRFESTTSILMGSTNGTLTITTLPMTPQPGDPKNDRRRLGGQIDISDFNEAPHLIAQRIERAYTSFKAHNTLP